VSTEQREALDAILRQSVRDWAREETVADVIEIVLTERLLKG